MAFGSERFDAKYRSRTPPAVHRKQYSQPKFIHDGRLFLYEGSIFDKLQDPQLYTGSHKCRFDQSTGRGKGLRGRDSATVTDSVTYFADNHGIRGDDSDGRRWVSSLRAATHYPTALESLTTLGHVSQNGATASAGRLREVQTATAAHYSVHGDDSSERQARAGAGPLLVSVALDPSTGQVQPVEQPLRQIHTHQNPSPHSDSTRFGQHAPAGREAYHVAPASVPYPQQHVGPPSRERPAMSFAELMKDGDDAGRIVGEQQWVDLAGDAGGGYAGGPPASGTGDRWIAPATDRGPKRTHALVRDREAKSQISGLFRQMLQNDDGIDQARRVPDYRSQQTGEPPVQHHRNQQPSQHQQASRLQPWTVPARADDNQFDEAFQRIHEQQQQQQPVDRRDSDYRTQPTNEFSAGSRSGDGGAPTLDEMLAVMPHFSRGGGEAALRPPRR